MAETYSGRTWISCGVSALVLAACAGGRDAPPPLTLIDSLSGVPIEGALVFAPGSLTVYRSDVRGNVDLPSGYGDSGLRIHAQHYLPIELATGSASAPVRLREDPAQSWGDRDFSRPDSLLGSYGPFRENYDLLYYDLDVVVDIEGMTVGGTNRIVFRMLQDGNRIQVDLNEAMLVDAIRSGASDLAYTREAAAVFIDFPDTLPAGQTGEIEFVFSGTPDSSGRFSGFSFAQDSLGNPWVTTTGTRWWPNKDQYLDEVDSMEIHVTVPTGLVDASNGRLMGVDDRGDGTTTYHWKVHYPINNYSVSLNIAKYEQFSDTLGDLTLDFYALPYHMAGARRQFAQAKPMLECFNRYFGDYPFPRDGFKLIEVPYSGMEHQSAVTYGNRFENGYLERDWTGVGVSPRFDFIIIHESGHEWFGNSVTARDQSDAWIQEGIDTYAEMVYVECMYGYDDAIRYINGYKPKIANREAIIGPPGVANWPAQDQYFKGALFMNTLRHVVADDAVWWPLIKSFAEDHKHQNIWTVDVINYFNEKLGRDVRPLFEQYLFYPPLPVLELVFSGDEVRYRWRADVEDFDMPVLVRTGSGEHTIQPRTDWRSEPLNGVAPDAWQPATELFYIEVERH